jgi:hypothetical protein
MLQLLPGILQDRFSHGIQRLSALYQQRTTTPEAPRERKASAEGVNDGDV